MVIAGIVAGGKGSRMGNTELPKQFMELCGKPVIIRTAQAFLDSAEVDNVIIGINPDWYGYMLELCDASGLKGIYVTKGGSDRNATVGNIISFAGSVLGASDDDIILTHDAVRPFVTPGMISDSIKALESCEICTVAVGATDTMIISEDGVSADEFPLRSRMFNVQTPQSFRIGSFRGIMASLSREEREAATDVCRLYKSRGYEVRLIPGSTSNIKLTYPSDMIFAEALLSGQQ